MVMVSLGHPVCRQDAKEKPLQTQKTNHSGIINRPTMPPIRSEDSGAARNATEFHH